jgi:hypothetical protein
MMMGSREEDELPPGSIFSGFENEPHPPPHQWKPGQEGLKSISMHAL